MTGESRPRITAVLGPTNTGKTHLAMERLMGHASGMIGFPLRLLARENYDRLVRVKGAANVALVTGEERIIPQAPRWFVCTVEAMPDRRVDFLAIDEIQLCADRERGHVFTDRLLNARGARETMFLGADTIRPILRRLVPEAEIITRPRFSQLSYLGPRKLTRLPKRSAVVAFSAAEVYGIAELIRRQKGGAAVVFGALSPRTRNAQVAMFQAGEVEHVVATDAIGMGLNMDIDHVAFAQLVKFDGLAPRRLGPAELGQIAGRAGRHMNDGTFGTTAEIGALEPETIAAIEDHRFPALRHVYWRNEALDFRSPDLLLRSLERRAEIPELIRVRDAIDHLTLATLMRDESLRALAHGPHATRQLWEVCQIPDFRKSFGEGHAHFVAQVFRHLRAADGRLPTDWVARAIQRLDSVEGDIDALLQRIAHIRTWTYVTHRGDWLADATHWQARARAVEDRLSDALHARLTQRFVDRRAAVALQRRNVGGSLLAELDADGAVSVEGEAAGRLDGFSFHPAPELLREGRAFLAAANAAVRQALPRRVQDLCAAPDGEFALDGVGIIRWRGQRVGRLQAGEHALAPRVALWPSDLLDPEPRARIAKRLQTWITDHLAARLAPLARLAAATLEGPARGIAFELVEALGVCRRARFADRIVALDRGQRGRLQALGVVFGEALVFLPALRRCDPGLRAFLWSLHRGVKPPDDIARAIARPPTLPLTPGWEGIAGAAFYVVAGDLLIRADRLEGFARAAAHLAGQGPFAVTAELARGLAITPAAAGAVLAALGYRRARTPEGEIFTRVAARPRRRRVAREDSHSPFAQLAALVRK